MPNLIGTTQLASMDQDTKALTAVQAGEKGLAAGNPASMLKRMLVAQEASLDRQAAGYYSLGQTCALLGDRSKATQYLQLAFDNHDANLVVLTVDPCFANMRDEPAFREMVARVGVARQAPGLAAPAGQ